jgi:glycosyltransferase involved in cell wall biosynthesis
MSKHSVTAIVPAYNEEATVGEVIKVILSSPLVNELICINDGSEDETLAEINKFESEIEIINLAQNKGKGFAMTQGIKQAEGDILLFLDADFTNLTTKHIEQILEPVLHNQCRVVMGILEVKPIHKIFENLTGQRVYYKSDLLPHLEYISQSKYGVETYLNGVFNKKETKKVVIPGLLSLPKYRKFDQNTALNTYLKESVDIVRVLLDKKYISMRSAKILKELENVTEMKLLKQKIKEIPDLELREILEKYILRHIREPR